MNTPTDMNTPTALDIEELLTEAGIDFTAVARCPYPHCEVCGDDQLSAAA